MARTSSHRKSAPSVRPGSPKSRRTTAVAPDRMKSLVEQVKQAFEEFVSGSRRQRDRAKAHGDLLIRLRDECQAQGLSFTEVLAEAGVPTSTAYDHIKLAEAWDRVADEAKTLGVEFENLSIRQIVDRLRPAPVREGGTVRGAMPTAPPAATSVTPEKQAVRRRPTRADEARESAVKAYLKGLFGTEINDVRLYFQRRNQEIKVALTDDLVVIVPIK